MKTKKMSPSVHAGILDENADRPGVLLKEGQTESSIKDVFTLSTSYGKLMELEIRGIRVIGEIYREDDKVFLLSNDFRFSNESPVERPLLQGQYSMRLYTIGETPTFKFIRMVNKNEPVCFNFKANEGAIVLVADSAGYEYVGRLAMVKNGKYELAILVSYSRYARGEYIKKMKPLSLGSNLFIGCNNRLTGPYVKIEVLSEPTEEVREIPAYPVAEGLRVNRSMSYGVTEKNILGFPGVIFPSDNTAGYTTKPNIAISEKEEKTSAKESDYEMCNKQIFESQEDLINKFEEQFRRDKKLNFYRKELGKLKNDDSLWNVRRYEMAREFAGIILKECAGKINFNVDSIAQESVHLSDSIIKNLKA